MEADPWDRRNDPNEEEKLNKDLLLFCKILDKHKIRHRKPTLILSTRNDIKLKKQNHKERLKFIRWYADWVRKTPNKIWSKAQADFLDS